MQSTSLSIHMTGGEYEQNLSKKMEIEMKRILSVLLIALVACTSVFAAVNFSGSATIGYAFQYDHVADDWSSHLNGDDGEDSNTGSLNLNIADDNGLWSVTFEGVPTLDSAGGIAADVTVDLAKIVGLEDWTLAVGMSANDRFIPARAYSNNSGKSFDRIRTADGGYFANLTVGYSNYIQVQAALDPGVVKSSGYPVDGSSREFGVGLYSNPINGLEVSAAYIYQGEWENNEGAIGGAVDVNLGTMLDLGFNLGVSVADRYGFDRGNDFAATVYGGVDFVTLAAEYAYTSDEANFLWVGADFAVVDNLDLGVYVGANDVAEFADQYFVGGSIGYDLNGIGLGLDIEYAQGGGKNYYANSLTITPSLSVSF